MSMEAYILTYLLTLYITNICLTDNNFNFYLPTKVIAGIGQINALSECAKEFGSDILLITLAH